MRTNRNGVTENSEFNIDQEKFKEGITRVFGEEEKKFCDKCDQRFSYCVCNENLDSITKEEKEVLEIFIDKMKIKDMARKSFQNIPSDNGSEGFPESSSYIYGYMEGYQKAIEDLT